MKPALGGMAIAVAIGLIAPAVAAGDPAAGKIVFNKCRACHSLDSGENGIGPSLHGLFGRGAGTVEDFRYSPWMTQSGIIWDEETLGKYLTDPQGTVKGTKMTFVGFKDPKELADLVAYLAAATR